MAFRFSIIAATTAFLVVGAIPATADNMSSGMSSTNSMSNTGSTSTTNDHMAVPKKHKKKSSHGAMGSSMAPSNTGNGSMSSTDNMKGDSSSPAH